MEEEGTMLVLSRFIGRCLFILW